jgi:hypothetical protein
LGTHTAEFIAAIRPEGSPLFQSRLHPVAGPFLALALLLQAPIAVADATHDPKTSKPWRINDALPDWVSISAKHRTRYEFLDDEFRAGTRGDREILVLRTLVHGRLKLTDGLWLGAEVEDSRAVVNGDTVLNNGIVNPVELLRAYLEFKHNDILGGKLSAQAGRITIDVGSRRFVSRSRYRNTINNFTGIDVGWKSTNGTELRGFWTLPIRRQPNEIRQLRENKVQDDEEDFDLQFWGLFAASDLPIGARGEVFFFGLHEKDEPSRRTRRRDLYTPGFRIFRKAETARFDYSLESVFQFGHSRTAAEAAADTARTDHFAHFHHIEVGYTFDTPWSPRILAQYDYASGGDSTDGDKNRFDSLFGARRFDFGPTGIYGPFARSNLSTPGLRLQLKPSKSVTTFVAVRSFWLADRRDVWASSLGVRDASGKSGNYLGSQIEMRVRWDVLPGNLRIESGYAHLFEGEFIKDAPNSSQPGDLNYFYLQAAIAL